MAKTNNQIDPFYQFFQRIIKNTPQVEQAFSLFQRLLRAWEEGHTFITLSCQEIATTQTLLALLATQSVSPLILDGNRLFLGKIYSLEDNTAKRLYHLMKQAMLPLSDKMPTLLQTYFPLDNEKEQQMAAAMALLNCVTVICGGPGTGKTTTVAKILALLCQNQAQLPRIALSAPTGKAAAHLNQSIVGTLKYIPNLATEIYQHLSQLQGRTLHRLLNIRPTLKHAEYNQQNPLPYDIVIIDEVSMIELNIMYQLLNAIGEKTRLILLGDKNQLPSVGAGSVLEQISLPTELNNQKLQAIKTLLPQCVVKENSDAHILSSSIAHLSISHRFHQNSAIFHLSNAIIKKDAQTAIQCFTQFPGELSQKTNTKQLYKQYYDSQKEYWQAIAHKDIKKAFECFYQTMVLCVLRYDAQYFNQQFLSFLRQQGKDTGLFNGRAIMINKNNVALDIYNGDIGIVFNHKIAIQRNSGEIEFIEPTRVGTFDDAFAITVHKSQGSEYENVFFIAPTHYNENTCGNIEKIFDCTLLYTAVTRSKKRFSYIGDLKYLPQAIHQQNQRRSLLKELIYRIS